MFAHLKYIFSILKHKWWVFAAACRLGIPVRGAMHDLSKFLPGEYLPRVRTFQKYKECPLDLKKQTWNPEDEDEAMQLCWLRHYHCNPHHWQWWVTFIDNGKMKVFPMDDCSRREMLADWLAVSRRPDRLDIVPWYRQNKDKIILHPETRKWIEEELGVQ